MEKFIAANDGTCDVCGRSITHGRRGEDAAYIDHDHGTGSLRGVLCHHCNAGLGMFRDNPDLLRKAAKYLERA